MVNLLKRYYAVYILIGIITMIFIFPSVAEAIAVNNSAPIEKTKDKQSLYYIVAIVGGAIGITLTYVSWKKYKAEEKKKIKKDSNS